MLGSAAAYYASKKGAKVIALEQYELGHVQGASHDTSRIVRTSYEAPEYVALAKSAYKDWADLEKAAQQKLLTITGGVVVIPKEGGVPAPDRWSNGIPTAADWIKGLEANNMPYELLNHTEANARWPQFDLKEDMVAIYSHDTGIVHAAKSVSAMQFLARMQGAVMKERTKVERVTPNGSDGGVTIETSSGSFSASKVIITADGWINELLEPLGVVVPLQITQEQVTYFKPSNPDGYWPDKFPVWLWVGPQWYYGFPSYGEPTIKAGADNDEQYMTHAERTFVPSEKAVQELSTIMQRFMPDPGRKELRTVTCMYTRTPDRQFVISPLPTHKDILVGLGAAHAFKFAPAIGRILAELAVDGETKDDITKFGLESIAAPAGLGFGNQNPRRTRQTKL